MKVDMYTLTHKFEGILFIGDPHVCSTRVGRRKDDYLASVLTKLDACATLCNKNNWLPVILGDLLHKWHDNNLRMLNRLTRTLNRFENKPMTLEGNHDKGKTHLDEEDALALLKEAGTILVMEEAGAYFEVTVQDTAVRIWACPHGAPIPQEVPTFNGVTVLVTHHDLAFGSSYMGAEPLTEVRNCELAVNGHMHATKPSVKVGQTLWTNPGNIEPLSLDLRDHIPKAWSWTPASDSHELTGHPLPHGTDLFDLAGTTAPADAGTAVAAYLEVGGITAPDQSKFAQLIRAQTSEEASRTDDGSVLGEDLHAVLEVAEVSEATKALLVGLFANLAGTSNQLD